jgi:phosphate transport system permease protein
MTFFCGFMGFGTSITAGCLTLALMIIPTTMRSTEEVLKSVPKEYREASFALGCGKLRTILKVVLPSALSGIFAGIILGIGRMVSESAPVLFTMGASIKPMPKGYSSGGTTLTVALYVLGREGKYTDEAYATACVLIIIVLALNLLSTLLGNKLQRKLSGGKKGDN